MSVHRHRREAPTRLRVAIITVSDTRTKQTDTSGELLACLLEEAGHEPVDHRIVRDEIPLIQKAIHALMENAPPHAIILTGGTGISPRDITPEAVRPLLDKEIPGYGELFRMLSHQEIGAAAMLSRAIAGTINQTIVIATPGSRGAVELAMKKLILPELGHLVREAEKRAEG